MGTANYAQCNSASGYGKSWFFSTINANIAFQKAFEVLSKSVTAKLLKVIQETIDAGRIKMTDEEAVILYRDKISLFVKTHSKEPNINSTDPLERRMAEALIYLRNKKRQQSSGSNV